MTQVPAIAKIISDANWRETLSKMRPFLIHKYPDYSKPKADAVPSTDKIFLAEMSLTDVYKILDDFNSQTKK